MKLRAPFLGLLLLLAASGCRVAGEVPRTSGNFGSVGSNERWGVDPELALDRVFVRGLTVLDARVLNETASDHVPLFVGLRFAAE